MEKTEYLRESIYFTPLQTSIFRCVMILSFKIQPIVCQFKTKNTPAGPDASKTTERVGFTTSFQVSYLVSKPTKAASLHNFYKTSAEGSTVDDASLPN